MISPSCFGSFCPQGEPASCNAGVLGQKGEPGSFGPLGLPGKRGDKGNPGPDGQNGYYLT